MAQFPQQPYSSFEATYKTHKLMLAHNYERKNKIYGLEQITYEGKLMKDIVPTVFLRFFSGNFLQSSHDIFQKEEKKLDFDETFGQQAAEMADFAKQYNTYLYLSFQCTGPADRANYQERTRHFRHEIVNKMETLTPKLLRLNEINVQQYKLKKLDRFRDTVLSFHRFESLATYAMNNFFYFSCYAKPSERLHALEAVVRKGKELLPRLKKHTDAEAEDTTNLWIAIAYYDFAIASDIDMPFNVYECVKHQKKQGMFSKLQRYDLGSAPKLFGIEMRKIMHTDPRARQAYFFVDGVHNFRCFTDARLADLLVHMTPMFSLVTRGAIAFASGLHPRLGQRDGTYPVKTYVKRKSKRVCVVEERPYPASLVASLDTDLVRIIWRFVLA